MARPEIKRKGVDWKGLLSEDRRLRPFIGHFSQELENR